MGPPGLMGLPGLTGLGKHGEYPGESADPAGVSGKAYLKHYRPGSAALGKWPS
jgi:hypothetical protein